MSVESWTDLKAVLASYTDRSDATDVIPDFIWQAEQRLARDLNLRFTDVEVADAMVTGQDFITLPDDCWEPTFLRLDVAVDTWVRITSMRDFTDKRNLTAPYPLVALAQGLTLKLSPTPTGDWDYTLFYKSGIPHLSADSETNWLTENAFDVLRLAGLLEMCDWLGDDPRCAQWQQSYASRLRPLQQQEWRARVGGGPVAVKPGCPVV